MRSAPPVTSAAGWGAGEGAEDMSVSARFRHLDAAKLVAGASHLAMVHEKHKLVAYLNF
jgi:hypothetical protein